MTTSPVPPAVSIGAVLGDSDAENMAWKRSINELGKQVVARREGVTSPLSVNVVFHVDGKLMPNEFKGVRSGRYSEQTAHLMVQAAVPPGPVNDRRSVLLDLLDAAVNEAENFARRHGIADELRAIRGVTKSLSS